MPEKKQNWIALTLNFFLPGAGHIYAGQTQKGVIIIVASVVCWVLIELVVPALGVIGLWVYAMATTTAVVDQYNEALETNARQRSAELASTITPSQFTEQISKFNQLLAAEIINAEEFAAKKLGAIQQLATKKLVGPPDDMLLAIAPMKKSNVLTDEEIKQIKQAIMRIA